jgi:hypothetical protein
MLLMDNRNLQINYSHRSASSNLWSDSISQTGETTEERRA